jgi:hypothetical protein
MQTQTIDVGEMDVKDEDIWRMQQNGARKVHYEFAIQYLLSECRRYGATEIPEDTDLIIIQFLL